MLEIVNFDPVNIAAFAVKAKPYITILIRFY